MQFRLSNSQRYLVNANPNTNPSTNPTNHDLRKFSFTNRIVNIWNSLPNVVVEANI